MYKRILVPLDGSELAEVILPLVCTLARVSNAEIVLLHVAVYPYEMYFMDEAYNPLDPMLAETIQNKKKVICREVEGYLKGIASNIEQTELKVVTEVREGPIIETILASIESLHIDLIVISTYGLGGGSPWMMGSVSNRILCEAKVPVIQVRPEPGSSILDFPLGQNVTLREHVQGEDWSQSLYRS